MVNYKIGKITLVSWISEENNRILLENLLEGQGDLNISVWHPAAC